MLNLDTSSPLSMLSQSPMIENPISKEGEKRKTTITCRPPMPPPNSYSNPDSVIGTLSNALVSVLDRVLSFVENILGGIFGGSGLTNEFVSPLSNEAQTTESKKSGSGFFGDLLSGITGLFGGAGKSKEGGNNMLSGIVDFGKSLFGF